MAVTWREETSPEALEEFEERCRSFRTRLASEDFLNNRGLGNEVGVYTFCYDPTLEARARAFFDDIVKGGTALGHVVESNLYDAVLAVCEDYGILDAASETELRSGSAALLEDLGYVVAPAAVAEKVASAPHGHGDVLLVTGVGEAYPLVRAHTVLDNIQHLVMDVPLVLAYPGHFDGQSLSLFGRIKDGNYYRAFDLV